MTRHPLKDGSPLLVLNDYLSDIRADELLSAEEERNLAAEIARGNRDARARLIRANLRLVVTIARDYTSRGLGLEDLIGEGNLGLIRAAEDYDPRFGTRFSTYAAYWIKQAIRSALTNTTATIRLPAHMVGLLSKWRRAERSLSKSLGQPPRPEQVAAELNLTPSQRTLIDHALQASRLSGESGGGEDGIGWSGFEALDPSDPVDHELEADEERAELYRRLRQLGDRERTVLVLRYGLGGHPPLTLKEVGLRLGVTREWVRKIEVRAVQKLENPKITPAPNGRQPSRSGAVRTRRAENRRLAQLQSV